MQKTIMTTPEVECCTSEEIGLSEHIIATLEGSEELAAAVLVWEKSIEAHARITRELEEMRTRRGEINAEIEAVKKDFGAENSFEDLRKIEALQSELATIAEVEPLLDRKLWYESPFNREIRDNASRAINIIDSEFRKIRLQLEENIDHKVNELLQTVATYHAAAVRARSEQKVVPSRLLRLESIRKIVPEVEGLEKLVAGQPQMIAGAVQRGINIANSQPARPAFPTGKSPMKIVNMTGRG